MKRTAFASWVFALIVLQSVFVVAPVGAEELRCSTPLSTERAYEVLNSVQSAYEKIKTLHANFLQDSYMQALDISELSQGQVYFQKPGRSRWKYFSPDEQDFLLRDDRLTYFQPSLNQALIEKVDKFLLSDLPVAFLMGIGDLRKDFELVQGCAADGTGVIALELKPKSSQGELSEFELLVDTKTFLPSGARIHDISGNVTKIMLEDMKTNVVLDDATFQIDLPSGIDVEDHTR